MKLISETAELMEGNLRGHFRKEFWYYEFSYEAPRKSLAAKVMRWIKPVYETTGLRE
jgi:hypothetical protein